MALFPNVKLYTCIFHFVYLCSLFYLYINIAYNLLVYEPVHEKLVCAHSYQTTPEFIWFVPSKLTHEALKCLMSSLPHHQKSDERQTSL